MFVDHPSPGVTLDREDPALKFGVRDLPQALLEGFQEAVGHCFES
jgi:hypothetical protein